MHKDTFGTYPLHQQSTQSLQVPLTTHCTKLLQVRCNSPYWANDVFHGEGILLTTMNDFGIVSVPGILLVMEQWLAALDHSSSNLYQHFMATNHHKMMVRHLLPFRFIDRDMDNNLWCQENIDTTDVICNNKNNKKFQGNTDI